MAVRVNSCQPTKSGKAWRVNLGGTYYNAFKDSGIENYVGKMIEAEITTSEKFGPAIAAFRPVAEQQSAAPQSAPATSPAAGTPPNSAGAAPNVPQYAEPSKNVAPFWLPFASNTVNAAIAAGLIKDTRDIAGWVSAVRLAAVKAADDSDVPW